MLTRKKPSDPDIFASQTTLIHRYVMWYITVSFPTLVYQYLGSCEPVIPRMGGLLAGDYE